MRIRIAMQLVPVLCAFFVLSGTNQHANAQTSQPTKQITPYKDTKTPSKHSSTLPTAEFGTLSRETRAEQIRRQNREGRRMNYFQFVADPGRLVDGQQETTYLRIEEVLFVGDSDPAYPASISSTVIVGTVLGGKGFVSEDRTYVYSDYRIRIDQVLKQDPDGALTVGGNVVVSRPGATVAFPSGHVTRYMVMDRGHPRVGKQYLLFLWKLDPSLAEYEILYGGAYELSNGRAYPLDDGFHYFRASEDGDANLLVAKVKGAIARIPK